MMKLCKSIQVSGLFEGRLRTLVVTQGSIILPDDVVHDTEIHQRRAGHLSLLRMFEQSECALKIPYGLVELSLPCIICSENVLNTPKRLTMFELCEEHTAAAEVGCGLLPLSSARIDLSTAHVRFSNASFLSCLF